MRQELNLKDLDDWYLLSSKDIKHIPKASLLRKHSVVDLLGQAYPDHLWDVRKLSAQWKNKPSEQYKPDIKAVNEPISAGVSSQNNQITNSKSWLEKTLDESSRTRLLKLPRNTFVYWLKQLAETLGLKELNDWYTFDGDVKRCDTTGNLDKYFQGSIVQALLWTFPEHQWKPWQFKGNVPHGYWNSLENQRYFMDWLGNDQGFKELDDWYCITRKCLVDNGGSGLLKKYGESPVKLLQATYPLQKWDKWFQRAPTGYWNDKANQQEFMLWLGEQLGFKDQDDWYNITKNQIVDAGGISLLNHYGCSKSKLLEGVFHTNSWLPWKFKTVPRGFWNDLDNQRAFINWVAGNLGLNNSELESITKENIIKYGGSTLLNKYASISAMLRTIYTEKSTTLTEVSS
jgi:hypothetical protein